MPKTIELIKICYIDTCTYLYVSIYLFKNMFWCGLCSQIYEYFRFIQRTSFPHEKVYLPPLPARDYGVIKPRDQVLHTCKLVTYPLYMYTYMNIGLCLHVL